MRFDVVIEVHGQRTKYVQGIFDDRYSSITYVQYVYLSTHSQRQEFHILGRLVSQTFLPGLPALETHRTIVSRFR